MPVEMIVCFASIFNPLKFLADELKKLKGKTTFNIINTIENNENNKNISYNNE